MVSMVGDLWPIECLQDYQDSPALKTGTNIFTSPRQRQSSVRAQLMVSMVGNQCRIESPQIIQQSPALSTDLCSVVYSLNSFVSCGSVSTRTFHDDWKQTSLRPQAESAKVASSSDENRTGDNSSNLATVIDGPGTEDSHYTSSSASRTILLNNFLSDQAFTNVNDIANTPELVIKPGVLCTVLGSRYYFALIHAILLQCIWFCVQG